MDQVISYKLTENRIIYPSLEDFALVFKFPFHRDFDE